MVKLKKLIECLFFKLPHKVHLTSHTGLRLTVCLSCSEEAAIFVSTDDQRRPLLDGGQTTTLRDGPSGRYELIDSIWALCLGCKLSDKFGNPSPFIFLSVYL